MNAKHVLDHLGWAVAICAILALVAVLAGIVHAGPLDPPGMPGPTMKTLEEVEPRTPISSLPYTITQPGSYYVIGNLTGVPGEHGITIAASNVTLDLSGFTLAGGGGDYGIFGAGGDYASVRVMNGTVTGWTQSGVEILGTRGVQIDAVRSDGNKDGINVAQAVVGNCIAANNSGTGVSALRSTVVSCHSSSNAIGFSLTDSSLRDCEASVNTARGIQASGSTVEQCTLTGNAVGIVAVTASSIRSNALRLNIGDGIQVTGSGSSVIDNVLESNGHLSVASGVYVSGTSNRIEGNHASGPDQDIGFAIYGSGNTFVRNSARGNVTNYDIGGANDAAPVAAATSTMNPWANLQSP